MKPLDCADLYSNGQHYDLISSDLTEDIPFYQRRIQEYGQPVLELACGTGRLTIPLKQSGIDIDGIDASPNMLAHARLKARQANLQISLFQDDVRQFIRDRRYSVILFPFNSIAHLHSIDDFVACMSCVKRHLNPGGVMIIDMFIPDCRYLVRDPLGRFPVATYDDPNGNGTVVVTESNRYDPSTQINHIVWWSKIGSKPEIAVENNMKMYFPIEFDALFRLTGCHILQRYGDYSDTPFGPESGKQLMVVSPANLS